MMLILLLMQRDNKFPVCHSTLASRTPVGHMAGCGFSCCVSGLTILPLKNKLRSRIWNVNTLNVLSEALMPGIVIKHRCLGRIWIDNFTDDMDFRKMHAMILERGLVICVGAPLYQPHNLWSIYFGFKEFHTRGSQIAYEEILHIKLDAMNNIKEHCLQSALHMIRRVVPLHWPQCMPKNMIYGPGQILQIVNKEMCGIGSILGQRLHH
jgi:hypothetical protein